MAEVNNLIDTERYDYIPTSINPRRREMLAGVVRADTPTTKDTPSPTNTPNPTSFPLFGGSVLSGAANGAADVVGTAAGLAVQAWKGQKATDPNQVLNTNDRLILDRYQAVNGMPKEQLNHSRSVFIEQTDANGNKFLAYKYKDESGGDVRSGKILLDPKTGKFIGDWQSIDKDKDRKLVEDLDTAHQTKMDEIKNHTEEGEERSQGVEIYNAAKRLEANSSNDITKRIENLKKIDPVKFKDLEAIQTPLTPEGTIDKAVEQSMKKEQALSTDKEQKQLKTDMTALREKTNSLSDKSTDLKTKSLREASEKLLAAYDKNDSAAMGKYGQKEVKYLNSQLDALGTDKPETAAPKRIDSPPKVPANSTLSNTLPALLDTRTLPERFYDNMRDTVIGKFESTRNLATETDIKKRENNDLSSQYMKAFDDNRSKVLNLRPGGSANFNLGSGTPNITFHNYNGKLYYEETGKGVGALASDFSKVNADKYIFFKGSAEKASSYQLDGKDRLIYAQDPKTQLHQVHRTNGETYSKLNPLSGYPNAGIDGFQVEQANGIKIFQLTNGKPKLIDIKQ